MKKVIAAFTGLIMLLIVGILVIVFVPSVASSDENDPLAGVKAASMNAFIDMSGLKDKAANALHDNLGTISAATGLSEADCAQIVYSLDIQNWEAAVLPNSAEEMGSLSGSYAGLDGTITYSDDPEYITVNAYGQNVTMKIPETAQAYLPYLQYAEQYLDQAA